MVFGLMVYRGICNRAFDLSGFCNRANGHRAFSYRPYVVLPNGQTRHVRAISSSCFYHIRAIRHIRLAITDDMAKLVACSLVGSRLDYANSALFGVSQANIHRLQRIQNAVTHTWWSGQPFTNLPAGPQPHSVIFIGCR